MRRSVGAERECRLSGVRRNSWRQVLTAVLVLLSVTPLSAQDRVLTSEQVLADMDSPSFVPTVKVGKVLEKGDSIQYMEMNPVYVFPQLSFKNKRQARNFMRLVTNVKKVLPLAKEARQILIETTEFMETLPNEKAKDEHIKRVEKDIFRTYKPKMKKLTYSQGKLLIKLIDRECHSSSYEMIKAFMGPLRAGFWQTFAWAFGASLRKEYDAEGTDRLTERVVLMVEAGQI
ncbi:MAG: DUF4294 domain-containing protein [Prevotella sp.]|nr:DUF4294 domain-containing protein [Prevotella sp.]